MVVFSRYRNPKLNLYSKNRKDKQKHNQKIDKKPTKGKKARDFKKKFKTTKKLRTINLENIQSEIGKGTSKQPLSKKDSNSEVPSAPQSVKMKVKGVLAKMDTKTRKKTYKKS